MKSKSLSGSIAPPVLVGAMGQTSTDAELLDASKRGEMNAFGEIVERYQKLVSGVCFSATGNWALSEDVAQDTFIAAWAGLAKVREPSRLAAWLCGIARNLSHKALRRGRREVTVEVVEAVDDRSPLDDAIDRETQQMVWQSLERIPARYREPLVLFYREGQSARAIAEGLGLSEAAVHQRLSRGRRHLEKQVSSLVETTLSRHRPKKGFTAAVLAAIAAGVIVTDAHAATGGTTMTTTTMTMIGGAALLAGVFATGWFASGDGSDEPAPKAPAAEIQDAPPSAVSPGRAGMDDSPTKSPTAQNPGLRPATVVQTKRLTKGRAAEKAYAHYDLSGVKKDWADGRLGQLLGDCFDGIDRGKYELAIDIDKEIRGVRLVGGDALGTREDEIEDCLLTKLTDFGLKPIPGEAVSLDVGFDQKKKRPEFDPEMMGTLGIEHAPYRGPLNAKVTMIVFTGFKCVFCGRLLGTLDQLLDEYPKDLRVVTRPFALYETDVVITEAAYAAEAQGKFWSMHDAMFADQDGLSPESLRTFARRAGLDLERFDADMAARTFKEQVETEREEAKAAGVGALPTVVLGGERIMGARPIDEFRTRINALR